MSSQKGNALRRRPQKHCNARAFRNNVNDKSPRVKAMNGVDLKEWDLCKRCTEIIQWKINYKKYKSLTCPKKCIKCFQKSVKRAYCTICTNCAQALNVCEKCAKNKFEDEVPEKDAILSTGTGKITQNVSKKTKHSKKQDNFDDDDDDDDDEDSEDESNTDDVEEEESDIDDVL